MLMRLILLGTVLAPLSLGTSSLAAEPLKIAHDLGATKFKDWHYGSDPKKKQVDCVQFVLAVTEESLQMSLTPKIRSRILISDLSAEELKPDKLAALVIANDDRIKGVQSALVEAKLGTAVTATDAAPGDLIQYWMRKADKTWFGHSGVIESVNKTGATPTAKIFGAHASPAPHGKIGVGSFDLKLIEDAEDRRIYLVRLK